MGYAKTIEYGDNFAIGSGIVNTAITTIPATSYSFGAIAIPSDMKIRKIYLDLMIRAIYSDSGAVDNHTVHAGTLVAVWGGTNYTALTIPIGSLHTIGASMCSGAYFHGNLDVKDGFRAGQLTNIWVDDWEAETDHIHLMDCQSIARVILY